MRAGFVLALACLVAVAVLSYESVQRLRVNAAWVEHTHQVLTLLDRLTGLATDAESAERGYVITGDEEYVALYAKAAGATDQVEQQLRRLIADNLTQEQGLERLDELIGERMAALRAVNAARGTSGFAAAQQLVRSGPGKHIHDQLERQIRDIAAVERSLLQARERRANRSTTITLLLGVGSSALALLCLGWAALVSRRDMVKRRSLESEREALREHLAVQLEDMRRLHELSSKLVEAVDLPRMLEEILDATMLLQRADFGNIQLYDPASASLRIVAQRGLSQDFLDHFRVVGADDASVCGRALRRRARVVVEDIERDPEFTPHLSTAAQSGFRGVQSTPLFGRDGAIKGMLSTHFRQAHRPSDRDLQMTDLYMHTAAALIERAQDTEEVRRARDEANRASLAKGRFLSTASHDLRQPLQTLSLLNGTLRRLIADGEAAQAIEQQEQAITAMSDLTNALLDINRLESGAVRPEIGEFTLAPLFAELAAEFAEPAARKGLLLEVMVPAELAVSDRTLLGQILRNLLGNAIRYTYSGSVRLTCERNGEELRITVADTGIGIAQERLKDIFEEFYQVGVSPNSVREGHGLGLSIVQRTVRLLNHELRVESRVGEGSAFSVLVPAGAAAPAADGTLEGLASDRAEVRPTHVLLVDDDAAVLQATRLLLRVEGYHVTASASLAEAMEKARQNADIELLITDFHLSEGSLGTDLMQAVEEILGRRIRTVLITGDTSSAISRLTRDDHVRLARKPIEADELLRLIAALMEATLPDDDLEVDLLRT